MTILSSYMPSRCWTSTGAGRAKTLRSREASLGGRHLVTDQAHHRAQYLRQVDRAVTSSKFPAPSVEGGSFATCRTFPSGTGSAGAPPDESSFRSGLRS